MHRLFQPVLFSTALLIALSGCSSSDSTVVGNDSITDANRPLTSQPVSVFDTFIAPARSTALPPNNSANLLSNGGFEIGRTFWNSCKPSTVSTSRDAYQGNNALSVDATSCLYQVVEAQAGDAYAFSCFVKLSELEAWTGIGMTFSNSDYEAVATAPSATATSGEYTRIETVGTATADTAFVGVWAYSEHGALLDNCTLTLEENQPMPAPASDGNLLVNSDFSQTHNNNQAVSWLPGCGNNVIADGSSLYLADGSCADQALGTAAIDSLNNRASTFSCAVAEVEGYADLSVFLDNTLTATQEITPSDIGQRVSVSVPASSPSNGFVTIFSDGNLRVEDCSLIADGATITTAPAAPAPAPINPSTPDTPEPVEPAEPVEPVDTTPVFARYRVTFNSTWSESIHPVQFPSANPHFSPLTGAVHNNQAQFWSPQQLATQGIKVVAETGNPSEFLAEINSAIGAGNAESAITGGGIPLSPGSTSVEFDISTDFPLVTLATMIAPSPDWFLGVHDLSLINNGAFVDTLTVPLLAYDAGTDSGVTYFSDDLATTPAQGISRLNSEPSDSSFQAGLPAAGELVFERIQ